MAGPIPRTDRPAIARGVWLMVLGISLLTIMDGCMKALTLTFTVAQAIFFRCLFALPILLFALPAGRPWGAFRQGSTAIQLLRGLLAFGTGFTFFTAVRQLPLADALSVGFAAPFIVALLSGPLLGEPASGRQWLSIVTGFAGVVVVLRPGFGDADEAALWALLAAFIYALNTLLLRRLGRTDPAAVTAIWGTAVPAVINGVLAVPAWVAPRPADFLLLVVTGVLGATGTLAITAAYRHAPAPRLMPLEYTALVWAVLIGFFAFGDVPAPAVVLGAVLIILSGLMLIRR